MDGAKAAGGKAVQAAQHAGTGADGGGGEDAARPLDAPAAAAGDEVDDEQVERFYTLLANIRAVRTVYVPGGGEDTASGGSGTRKRLRSAPWRPAFRLEDFAGDAAAPTSRLPNKDKERSQQQTTDDDDKGDGPVDAPPSLQPPRAGARRFDDDKGDGSVVAPLSLPPPRSGARRLDDDSNSI